jgi:clathrin light chain A
MTDPFDAFESNLGAPSGGNAFEDPAADFLAREQAELDKIENNNLVDDGFGDFNEFGNKQQSNEFGSSNGFESPDNMFGSENSPTNEPSDNKDKDWIVVDEKQTEQKENKDIYSELSVMDQLSIEPEKIKRWREEQKTRLENKDNEEDAKRKEWKESAQKELEEWYRKRSEQLSKTHDNNKASDAEMISQRDSQSGQEWERLAKLCDFNPKANKNTRDVSRMRSLLLQLKQQPLVR